jgi:large subunit ribosomal protein L25
MSYLLQAVKRTAKGEKTREEGKLPAVAYGAGNDALSLDLDYSQFTKLFKQAGESSLIDLEVDGKNIGKVLVQEVQYNPVKDTPIHVDFRRIDMNKVMHAPVVLKFLGEAPAVKEMGGTLVKNIEEVTVECLPKDLVSSIEVGLANLKTFDDVVKVKDLVLPAGIKVIAPAAEALVAKAIPALTEEEIKAMEEAGKEMDVSKIESSAKKKEEEAEGEEAPAEEKK